MIKLISLLKRKSGITKKQFRDHYENNHVKLAQEYLGHLLMDYRRNYPTFALLNPMDQPEGTEPEPYDFEYDAITEMYCKDEAAMAEMQRIINDPANSILNDDEQKFVESQETIMLVVDQVEGFS